MKAKTCQEAISYFEKAVQAGRNDLGENFFKENEGHFWGLIESDSGGHFRLYFGILE